MRFLSVSAPLKISIPEPCSEDWSKMTPTEQGAFCQKCALEVTDFTGKTPLQIKSILVKKIESKERVCGHIENRQMIEFNDGFIPWKSDQESFRAIWMLSLVAVFGMSLFSCQSTFSEEVVEKMRISSEVLMEKETDTLDLAKLNDSIQIVNKMDSSGNYETKPWPLIEPWLPTGGTVVMDGGMGWELKTEPFDISVCIPYTLGDFVLSGNISVAPTPEEIKRYERALFNFSPSEIVDPVPITPSPSANERHQQDSVRLEAKLENGRPQFAATISPNPVTPESRLFVTIPDEGLMKLSIWEISNLDKLYSDQFEMVFGNHAVDINFMDFAKGKYAIQLIWEDEKVVVPFEVLETSS